MPRTDGDSQLGACLFTIGFFACLFVGAIVIISWISSQL